MQSDKSKFKEAKYYEKRENGSVKCLLCPHYCIIRNGKAGICRARKNDHGTLYAINYGECVSLAIDPIEKKPLYHFHPGEPILSTAPNTCNFLCPYCQNASISQLEAPTEYISPGDLVNIAIRKGSFAIAYTYTEPLTWYEYLLETGKLAHQNGLKNVLVTNAMINEEPLCELLPLIDAANIDLKAIREDFYKKVVKGDLSTVLNTIRITKENGVHVEITNLIIPGYNDSRSNIKELVKFVASLGDTTPLHFSRYFPHYKFREPPTPVETLKMAWETGKKYLKYVYLGNVMLEEGRDTYCPNCGNLIVERAYFHARKVGIEEGKCKKCGSKVDFIL